MDAALGWVGDLARYLAQLLPRWVHVAETEQAVMFRRGGHVLRRPGVHFYWPLWTQVTVHPVVRQVVAVPPQGLVTLDERAVVVDAVLTFSICDLERFLVDNYDAEESLGDVAQAAVRRAVCSQSFPAIQEARAQLDKVLTREATKVMRPFGVEVEVLRLRTFVPAAAAHLLHSGLLAAAGADRLARYTET